MEESNASNADREYAAQFLGFVPSSFVDDLSEDSIELVASSLEFMKQKIVKTFPDKCEQVEVDKAFKKVEVKYQENQEKLFEKLGSWVCAHIFKIPGHVLLTEDEAWDGETSAGVASRLITVNTEMEVMRDKIKSALYKRAVLTSELEKIQDVCTSQEKVIEKDRERLKKCSIEDCKDLMDFTIEKKKVLAGRGKELELVSGEKSDSASVEDKLDLDNKIINKRRAELPDPACDFVVNKLRKETVM